jgi:hypothetical protein
MSIYRQNRSEFDWEREIRRDERRISSYYRELMYCLDLPGEEEIINEQLSGHHGTPVPAGKPNDVLNNSRRFFFDRDDEDDEEQPPRPYSPLVTLVDRLAAEWCAVSASMLDDRLFTAGGLAIACAYAKLLGRIADFADADPVREKTLRISLLKRAVADINDLAGAFREVGNWQPSIRETAARQIDELSLLRERLTDMLAEKK